jgi:hypothetical protein
VLKADIVSACVSQILVGRQDVISQLRGTDTPQAIVSRAVIHDDDVQWDCGVLQRPEATNRVIRAVPVQNDDRYRCSHRVIPVSIEGLWQYSPVLGRRELEATAGERQLLGPRETTRSGRDHGAGRLCDAPKPFG